MNEDTKSPHATHEVIICNHCEDGEIKTYWSCCGDEVQEDAELCPTCQEHIDGVEPDYEDCEVCKGEGSVHASINRQKYR